MYKRWHAAGNRWTTCAGLVARAVLSCPPVRERTASRRGRVLGKVRRGPDGAARGIAWARRDPGLVRRPSRRSLALGASVSLVVTWPQPVRAGSRQGNRQGNRAVPAAPPSEGCLPASARSCCPQCTFGAGSVWAQKGSCCESAVLPLLPPTPHHHCASRASARRCQLLGRFSETLRISILSFPGSRQHPSGHSLRMLAVGTEGCLAPALPLVAFPEGALGTHCPKEECACLEVGGGSFGSSGHRAGAASQERPAADFREVPFTAQPFGAGGRPNHHPHLADEKVEAREVKPLAQGHLADQSWSSDVGQGLSESLLFPTALCWLLTLPPRSGGCCREVRAG